VTGPIEAAPVRIVLGPDVLAKSFLAPSCRRILELWRDGAVRLVVSRELLAVYLRVLRGLGLGDDDLRRWALWFSAADRADLAPSAVDAAGGWRGLMDDAARQGGTATVVVCELIAPSRDSAPGPRWTSVEGFLSKNVGETG